MIGGYLQRDPEVQYLLLDQVTTLFFEQRSISTRQNLSNLISSSDRFSRAYCVFIFSCYVLWNVNIGKVAQSCLIDLKIECNMKIEIITLTSIQKRPQEMAQTELDLWNSYSNRLLLNF